MILGEKINLIRKISLALFICSLLSLMGSLWLQNTLAEFDFKNTPYDEKVFKGSASSRRTFLDRLVSNFDPSHNGRINNYNKLLQQRSKVLKDNSRDKE